MNRVRYLQDKLRRIERKYEKLPEHKLIERGRLMRSYHNTKRKLHKLIGGKYEESQAA